MTVSYTDSPGRNFTADYDDMSDMSDIMTTSETDTDGAFVQFANLVNIYYTPVLILLGCTGNILSIIVFYKSKLRLQSTSQYLSGLALSDTIFLCMLLPPWLKATENSTLFAFNGFCQVSVYLSYVTSNHSAWLVVAFTIERFVAVVYPLRRNAMCTVKRSRHIILSLALLSMMINLPLLRFVVSRSGECNMDSDLIEHAELFNIVDTMLSFTLPLSIIVVLNTWIMVRVYSVNRERGRLMREPHGRMAAAADEGPVAAVAAIGRPRRRYGHLRSQQRVTRMLLTVSSVFVLLNLPAYTMRIIAYASNMSENEYVGVPAASQQLFNVLFNSNFGINFILYCMSGQNFRRALSHNIPRLLFRRNNMEVHQDASQQPGASSYTLSAATCQTEPESRVQVAAIFQKTHRPEQVIQRWQFNNSPRPSHYSGTTVSFYRRVGRERAPTPDGESLPMHMPTHPPSMPQNRF